MTVGMSDYLSKPVKSKSLETMLVRWLFDESHRRQLSQWILPPTAPKPETSSPSLSPSLSPTITTPPGDNEVDFVSLACDESPLTPDLEENSSETSPGTESTVTPDHLSPAPEPICEVIPAEATQACTPLSRNVKFADL